MGNDWGIAMRFPNPIIYFNYGCRRVAGVPSGLQNRYELISARVGSIPTCTRQKKFHMD